MRRIPVDTLNAASQMMLDRGERILQGVRFADTDEGHVAKLLEFMDPPIGARIADMGCGFGEVARLMRAQRPDLSFVMVNDNEFQLSHAPNRLGMQPVLADMMHTGLPDESFDVVMFLYSLCHVDLDAALAEARRLVRPGAVLFVFDYVRTGGDDALAERHLGASFHDIGDLLEAMEYIGWGQHCIRLPDGDDAVFRVAFSDQKLYREIFMDLEPMLWRAVAR
jgi:SAM-dependent methyltransferase